MNSNDFLKGLGIVVGIAGTGYLISKGIEADQRQQEENQRRQAAFIQQCNARIDQELDNMQQALPQVGAQKSGIVQEYIDAVKALKAKQSFGSDFLVKFEKKSALMNAIIHEQDLKQLVTLMTQLEHMDHPPQPTPQPVEESWRTDRWTHLFDRYVTLTDRLLIEKDFWKKQELEEQIKITFQQLTEQPQSFVDGDYRWNKIQLRIDGLTDQMMNASDWYKRQTLKEFVEQLRKLHATV